MQSLSTNTGGLALIYDAWDRKFFAFKFSNSGVGLKSTLDILHAFFTQAYRAVRQHL